MSIQTSNDYLNSIDRAAKRIARNTTKTQEQQIMRIYKQAFNDSFEDYMNQLSKGKTPSQHYFMKCKMAYINQLYSTLQSQSAVCGEQIPKRILDQYAKVMKQIPGNEHIIDSINKQVDITSKAIVQQMVKGEIYKGGMGLDSRLWSATNASGRKIEDAITSCLARGIGSAEASKVLKEFAKEGHHTWDRKKIREKLGDGYASKYGAGGLDYEALRLMRTTNTHMAQLAVMNSDKVNPYNKYVKYHTGHAGARTCSMCKERNGQIFPIHDAPLDHPNGMCWLSPVMSLDGKTELSLGDMIDDINNYYDGKPNTGIMDKWLKEHGNSTVKPKAKPTQTKQPTNKTKPAQNHTDLPKGHLYTAEQRAKQYQILEDVLDGQLHNVLMEEITNPNKRAKVLPAYKQTTVKGIINSLKQYPEPLQDLYLHTAKQLRMFHEGLDGPYYSPGMKAIYFSVKATSNDTRGAYGTIFHEWGHLIDGQLKNGVVMTDEIKKDFYKVLKKDLDNRLQYHMDTAKVSKKIAGNRIWRELVDAGDGIAGVSDIYGGLTKNKITGNWGHKKDYWTRRDEKAEVCSEAWADILQSYGIASQREYINKFLPESKAYVEKYVEELIEQIKRGEIK